MQAQESGRTWILFGFHSALRAEASSITNCRVAGRGQLLIISKKGGFAKSKRSTFLSVIRVFLEHMHGFGQNAISSESETDLEVLHASIKQLC